MRKLSLFFIIFLLFIGGNAFASFTPTQSLMTQNETHTFTIDETQYTVGKRDTFTVTDRDTGTWGSYNYNNLDYYGYYDNDPSSPKWSGWYLGTVSGNDKEDDLLALIQYYFDDPTYSIAGIDKVDVPDGVSSSSKLTAGELKVTWDDDLKSGTWATTGGSSGTEKVEFYVVKGSDEYALYYMNPAELAGYWSTTHLLTPGDTPALSHLTVTYSVSNGLPPGTSPVPESGTILLLGVGLIGVAGIGRRKFQK